MKKRLVLTATIVLIILPYSVTAVSAQTNRDLKNYNVGPIFDLGGDFLGKAEGVKKDLRKYFWDIWTSKKQAYFKVYEYTREGKQIPCTYFVEENKIKSWQVVQVCTGICPYISKRRCREFDKPNETIFDKVEKINQPYNNKRNSNEEYTIVLTSTIPEYSKYLLKF